MNRTAPLLVKVRSVACVVALLAVGATGAAAQHLENMRSVCQSCHTGVDAHFEGALSHAPDVTCLTCHHIGYSNDPVVSSSRRLEACLGCHEELPRTHMLAGPEAPVCTSCHEIHADPAVAGPNLLAEGTCLSCHESRHTLHAAVGEGAPACVSCHALHTDGLPATEAVDAASSCTTCHEAPHPSHASVGELECTTCHDVDATTPVAAVKTELAATCETCHEDIHPTHMVDGEPAALCTDCHSFATDPPLAEAGAAISRNCGSCHETEYAEFEDGGHGPALDRRDPNTDAPTCVTCHTAHSENSATVIGMRLQATSRCIACHSDPELVNKYGLSENVGASYVDDFHGSTAQFLSIHPEEADQPDVMVCSDCHGAHAVDWRPQVATAAICEGCHEGNGEKLASAWLGHERIGPRNKVAVWAVRLFYYLLIPFVLLGLTLNILVHLINERRKGARVADAPGIRKLRALLAGRRIDDPKVTRFNAVERLEHLGAMLTFTLLVVTGLPQIEATAEPSAKIIHFFGGLGTMRLIHRATGFVFVTLMLIHVARGVLGVIRERRLPAIVPQKRDFTNTLQAVHHFLRGAPKPKIGKYDAAEKFEYWGLLLGGTLMSVTGLVLVFPELVTTFLPGIVVAVMRVMHGLEATFAVLVILLWHTWGVILRPEVFPLDTSIFTGKISLHRLREEHELEYERLFPGGSEGD